MNTYLEMKTRHEAEVHAFPMKFAFSSEQFEKSMRELGLHPTDTDKIFKISGANGFYRKSDAPALHEMFKRHEQERRDAILLDSTGEGYIYEMFNYELSNHEYSYTGELDETLDALGLTLDTIKDSPQLLHGLQKAIENQRGD